MHSDTGHLETTYPVHSVYCVNWCLHACYVRGVLDNQHELETRDIGSFSAYCTVLDNNGMQLVLYKKSARQHIKQAQK